MTIRVPEDIKAEALKHITKDGWKIKNVLKWLKGKGTKMTYAGVYAWVHPQQKDESATSNKRKATINKVEFEDGCMFSVKHDAAPLASEKSGVFECMVGKGVLCGGAALAKKKCSLWSGSGKVI
jgi:hypothetical protein